MKEYLINNKKYRLDLFERVETQEQAYLLGYLCGDGGFNKATHKRKARLYVSSSEKYIIESFQSNFCPDNEISSKLPINKARKDIISRRLSYSIHFSSKFSETFKKFGILAKKEDRRIVNISKKMFKYYLLGLFDADGCISWGKRKDRNRLFSNFQITHQSEQVLHYIQRFLHEELEISSFVNQRKDEKCLDLKVAKLDSVYKLYQYIYKDVDVTCNTSKYNNWTNFVKEYTNK